MIHKAISPATVGLAFLALVGCATPPTVPYSDAAPGFPNLKETDGRIFVYRSSHLGGIFMPAVYLSGEQVGRAVPRQVFFVDRPAGTYDIMTTTEVERKVTFNLTPGELKYVRLAPGFGVFAARIAPELVSRAEAEEELKELDFVTPQVK